MYLLEKNTEILKNINYLCLLIVYRIYPKGSAGHIDMGKIID